MKTIASLFRVNQPTAAPSRDEASKTATSHTAEKMLKTLAEAERLGLRARLGANNQLSLHDAPRSIWSRIRLLFERKPVGIENRDAIVGAVITKMKEQIRKSTCYVDEAMTEKLPDLGRFAQTGKVGDLRNQWTALQNILRSGAYRPKQVPAARNDMALPSSGSPLASARTSVSPLASSALAPQQSKVSKADDVAPAPDSAEVDTQDRIDEANRSLPKAMPTITRTGEIVRAVLTVPENVQRGMLDDWRQWAVHDKGQHHQKADAFVGLSEAFSKDADRSTYVFETGGFPIECDRDREAVVIGFKKAAGKNPMRQQILSHLLGQEALKRMLEKIWEAHPRADGQPFILGGKGTPEYVSHKHHMTVHDNGDVDVEYLSLMKRTNLLGDDDLIEINRSKQFEGPPSHDNAGMILSMKIRLSNSDLNRGQLRFTILEPLQVKLQVELPEVAP